MEIEISYMRRCLELAELGLGRVAPNPLVGAVVVCNGKIIGEGYHKQYGETHAEANAIASVKNKELLAASTLYVSLEPCCHEGKQPACTNLILQHRIPRVVVATTDPFPAVSGGGIELLRSAGVDVQVGVMEKEAQEQNRRFFTFHQKHRPYIILKWAESSDGYIDKHRTPETPPAWITGSRGKLLVHRWRTEEQAIMVGANTVVMDNPQLTARMWKGCNPLRVVFDRELSLPSSAAIFSDDAPTLIFTLKKQAGTYPKHVEVVSIGLGSIEEQIFSELYARGIQSVLVEGGAKLLNRLIEKSLWDEARIFTGHTPFYGGVKAPLLAITPTYMSWEAENFSLRIEKCAEQHVE